MGFLDYMVVIFYGSYSNYELSYIISISMILICVCFIFLGLVLRAQLFFFICAVNMTFDSIVYKNALESFPFL